MDAYINSHRSKTASARLEREFSTTHQTTQDGLGSRQRPSAGAYNDGDDGEEGGGDIDDGPWDATIDDPAANKQSKKQKKKEAAASAETIVKKKHKKKKMEEDHDAHEDTLKKRKRKINKKTIRAQKERPPRELYLKDQALSLHRLQRSQHIVLANPAVRSHGV